MPAPTGVASGPVVVKDEMLAELDEVPKLKLQLVSLQQELEAEKAKAGRSAPSLQV